MLLIHCGAISSQRNVFEQHSAVDFRRCLGARHRLADGVTDVLAVTLDLPANRLVLDEAPCVGGSPEKNGGRIFSTTSHDMVEAHSSKTTATKIRFPMLSLPGDAGSNACTDASSLHP